MGKPVWLAMPLLLVFSGCTASEKLFLSSGPVPRVEDCALIQQATPTRYMCGGKTYTSVELTDIRNGKPDKARVTASSSTGVVSLASTASPWRRAVQR